MNEGRRGRERIVFQSVNLSRSLIRLNLSHFLQNTYKKPYTQIHVTTATRIPYSLKLQKPGFLVIAQFGRLLGFFNQARLLRVVASYNISRWGETSIIFVSIELVSKKGHWALNYRSRRRRVSEAKLSLFFCLASE